MSSNVSFSFIPGEVVQPGTTLTIHTPCRVDRQAAISAVFLQQRGCTIRTPVTISDDSTTISISTSGLSPGSYRLHIRELLSYKGEVLVVCDERPVKIGMLVGKVPKEYRVKHQTHVAIGETRYVRLALGDEAPDGFEYLQFVKAVHRENGEVVEFAFNAEGKEVDGRARLADVEERRFKKFGRLHQTLHRHLERASDDDQIPVVAWPRVEVDVSGYVKPNRGEIKEPPEEAVQIQREVNKAKEALLNVLRPLNASNVDEMVSDSTPMVRSTLNPEQIRKLAESDTVGVLFLDDSSAKLNLADSLAVSRSSSAQAGGVTGAGIHVAVWEDGPKDVTWLPFAARFTNNPLSTNDDHARLVSAIIKNAEPGIVPKPHGYAPDCDLYSANTRTVEALFWAVRSPQLCTVINQSFYRLKSEGQDEQGDPHLSSDDHLKDWLTLQHPYPLIVHAAGDIDQNPEYVNHKGYNTISVASHDDNATALAGDSAFKNPVSRHGDRELPEIAANGTGVTALGLNMSGTSFAAPAVAGSAAQIQSADKSGVLKSWPEGCRAILLASADRNITGGTWAEDLAKGVDAADGAGALNCQLAVNIAKERQFRNNNPANEGWDVGTLTDADFDSTGRCTFRYNFKAPPPKFIPTVSTVKVALAWDSKISYNSGVLTSALMHDLDLWVEDSKNNLVSFSSSHDNSYEIVEFGPKPMENYSIVIRKFSGTGNVWYGIAWNITERPLRIPPSIPGFGP